MRRRRSRTPRPTRPTPRPKPRPKPRPTARPTARPPRARRSPPRRSPKNRRPPSPRPTRRTAARTPRKKRPTASNIRRERESPAPAGLFFGDIRLAVPNHQTRHKIRISNKIETQCSSRDIFSLRLADTANSTDALWISFKYSFVPDIVTPRFPDQIGLSASTLGLRLEHVPHGFAESL